MLSQLTLRHFSIITALSLEFKDGFTVLTGETGAGKSVILNAIGLLLGKQASESVIQDQAQETYIEGIFTQIPPALIAQAPELFDEGEPVMIVSRTISRNKPSFARINGCAVTVKQLRDLMHQLVMFIGQQETFQMLQNKALLSGIDQTSSAILETLSDYAQAYSRYKTTEKRLQDFTTQSQLSAEHRAFLTHQVEELKTYHLKPDEDLQLLDKKKRLKSLKYLSQLKDALYTHETHLTEDMSQLNMLSSKCDPELQITQTVDRYREAVEQVQEQLAYLKQQLDTLIDDQDPLDIDAIESRLDILFKLKTKYKLPSSQALLDHLESLQNTLKQSETFEKTRLAYQKDRDAAFNAAQEIAYRLYTQRQETVTQLTQTIQNSLHALDLHHARLVIQLTHTPTQLSSQGADTAELCVATNYQDTFGPISDIASGGEQARILLAIYAAFSEALSQKIMILDEVDVGIGGETALKVGHFIKQHLVGEQTFCVTHLAQLAKEADHHIKVTKSFEEQTVQTSFVFLSKDEHKQELKRMIGGEAVLHVISD